MASATAFPHTRASWKRLKEAVRFAWKSGLIGRLLEIAFLLLSIGFAAFGNFEGAMVFLIGALMLKFARLESLWGHQSYIEGYRDGANATIKQIKEGLDDLA